MILDLEISSVLVRCEMLNVMPRVKYSLEQRPFIYNVHVRKKSFKTYLKFRRRFPGISVLSKSTNQEPVKKFVKRVQL